MEFVLWVLEALQFGNQEFQAYVDTLPVDVSAFPATYGPEALKLL